MGVGLFTEAKQATFVGYDYDSSIRNSGGSEELAGELVGPSGVTVFEVEGIKVSVESSDPGSAVTDDGGSITSFLDDSFPNHFAGVQVEG